MWGGGKGKGGERRKRISNPPYTSNVGFEFKRASVSGKINVPSTEGLGCLGSPLVSTSIQFNLFDINCVKFKNCEMKNIALLVR